MAIVLLFTLFANIAYFAALGFEAVAQSTTVGLVGPISPEDVLRTLADIGFRHSASIFWDEPEVLSTPLPSASRPWGRLTSRRSPRAA